MSPRRFYEANDAGSQNVLAHYAEAAGRKSRTPFRDFAGARSGSGDHCSAAESRGRCQAPVDGGVPHTRANVVIAPGDSGTPADSPHFLYDSLFADLSEGMDSSTIPKAEFLYGVVDAAKAAATSDQKSGSRTKVILAGFEYSGSHPEQVISPSLLAAAGRNDSPKVPSCAAGHRAAVTLQLRSGDTVGLASGSRRVSCLVEVLSSIGSAEDSQIFLPLRATQMLLDQTGRISLIQLSVPGTSEQIQNYIASLRRIPGAEVRPISPAHRRRSKNLQSH